MPVLAIPLFWFMPFSAAGPLYVVIFSVSAWVYYLAIRAMWRPVETGTEALLRSGGEVVGKQGDLFRVRTQSEIWFAESADTLETGERVEIIAVKGLRLKVRRSRKSDVTAQGRE